MSLFTFIASLSSWADTSLSMTKDNSIQQTTENKLKNNQSELIEDKWSEWGLTREDWSRYQKLKEGPIGIWTPNLDPITLGIGSKKLKMKEDDLLNYWLK